MTVTGALRQPTPADKLTQLSPTRTASRDAGRPLDSRTRHMVESRFQHDFSQVRVHDGPEAAASAQEHGARAYAVGPDIVFGAGEYRPETRDGRKLLAHELAHVVQQERASNPDSRPGTPASAEREAGAAAARVSAGTSTGPITQSVPAGSVQHQAQDPTQAPQPAQNQPAATWDPHRPSMFSIIVDSAKAKPSQCGGYAGSSGGRFAMGSCGHIEHFCTTPASYPLRILAHTDSLTVPRPQPFTGPELRLSLDFVPDGASTPTYSRTMSDANPRYPGPGHALQPSFGTDFNISASDSGHLSVNYQLYDATHNVGVTYIDRIRCYLAPCA